MNPQDLKSDALRKRHWDKLMQETGKSFEMDPKTFTLANVFKMELHNFAAQIGYGQIGMPHKIVLEIGMSLLKSSLALGCINPHRVLVFSELLWHSGDAVLLIAYRTAILSCT